MSFNYDNLDAATQKALKEKLTDLNTRYGSKTKITKIDWSGMTFKAVGSEARKFAVESAARPGTYRITVAGQQGVTKPIAEKPVKQVGGSTSSAKSGTTARRGARATY